MDSSAAYAAGREFYDAEDLALSKLSIDRWDQITTSACSCRANVLKQVANLREKGQRFVGGGHLGLKISDFVPIGPNNATVSAVYSIGSGKVIDSQGKVVLKQPAFTQWQDVLALVRVGGTWRIGNIKTLTQGSPES